MLHPLLWLLGLVLFVTAMPIALALAALLSVAWPGPRRGLRLLAFGWLYLGLELLVMPIALASWLASGLGRRLQRPAFVAFHYRLFATVIGLLVRCGSSLFTLTVRRQPLQLPDDQRPLLVLSRHAGPGDSMLMIHELFTVARRRPRIVLKHTLQWDPMIDLVFHRLPMRFVDPAAPQPRGQRAGIAELARTMGAGDALLIFPEGRNVNPRRRHRAIERLRRAGREQAARRAERIRHLMPPRALGLQAALAARPDLDVAVVAHAGLDDLHTVPALWRAVAREKTLHRAWRTLPAACVPRDRRGQADWALAEWERMDAWVGAQRAA
ncbi:1-acyl-sn-glycerol-3-phosphate acyltransferase [Aquabacterium sp.]|uniref:1-acyl-sn-glycerol-3-phosphate acyltransferase n=1 Tax=Aquabacterium sp. TaxID=1872578 RepID=UPI00378453BB